MAKLKFKTLDMANAKVLAEIVAAEDTSEFQRVAILTKLMDAREHQAFFHTIFEEKLSLGECPECGHQNHWVVPEDTLNQYGWVSSKEDPKVPSATNSDICPEFAEACAKKRITM